MVEAKTDLLVHKVKVKKDLELGLFATEDYHATSGNIILVDSSDIVTISFRNLKKTVLKIRGTLRS